MMISGIGTSSGFEERIRFSELDIVDSNAIDAGVMNTVPEGNYINGWDVNVAAVRIVAQKRNIRTHRHAQFVLRVKQKGELEHFVARRYGDFRQLHKQLRVELPGRILPSLPKKNKSNSTAQTLLSNFSSRNGSDDDSISSQSTRMTSASSLMRPSGAMLTPRGQVSNQTRYTPLLTLLTGHSRTGSGSAPSVRSTNSRGLPASPVVASTADGHLAPATPPVRLSWGLFRCLRCFMLIYCFRMLYCTEKTKEFPSEHS